VDVRIDDVREQWESIGHQDPLWGVLSHEGKEHGNWDVEEFAGHGVRDVERIMLQLELLGTTPTPGDALDFGCGVGRLTRPLAERFERVTGLDVSAPMLEEARRLSGDAAEPSYVLNVTETLPFANDSFDFVLSLIVLQHMPVRLAKGYIREFVRVLRPGGVAVFQMPSEPLGGSASANPLTRRVMNTLPPEWREEIHRRRRPREVRDLPMHGLRRAKVLRLVDGLAGARVAACVEDPYAGPGWRSFTYVLRRAA
jgi:SAM-dependent methyltransferase